MPPTDRREAIPDAASSSEFGIAWRRVRRCSGIVGQEKTLSEGC
jgi:hypothetical protein